MLAVEGAFKPTFTHPKLLSRYRRIRQMLRQIEGTFLDEKYLFCKSFINKIAR